MGRFSKDNTTSIMEKHAEKTECDFQFLICHSAILGQAGSDLHIPLSQSSHSHRIVEPSYQSVCWPLRLLLYVDFSFLLVKWGVVIKKRNN